MEAGGKVIIEPFDLAIGKGAVVEDPWGNRVVIVDLTKGHLKVDDKKNVILS